MKNEQYPKPQKTRSGCKVGWNYYTLKEDADRCSIIAKSRAAKMRDEGYDFGYQSPGSVRKVSDNPEFEGLWEVCIP